MISAQTTEPAPSGGDTPSPWPEAAPARSTPAEMVELESLVHHREWVPHEMPLEEVHNLFEAKNVEYLAILRDGHVSGVCSRAKLGLMLGSRYGFALYSRSAAHSSQIEHPLVFSRSEPIRRILDLSLSRKGDEFHEDVVLVDSEHRLKGLIPVEALAHLQTRLVREQMGELTRNHEMLHRRNLELFQSNQALRQAQGLYQRLFESDAMGIALLDGRGVVQANNRRLAELFGLDPSQTVATKILEWIRERDRSDFVAVVAAHDRGRHASVSREFNFDIPGKGHRLFRVSSVWIRETSQVCACIEDVTEQRALERHLLHQEKQKLLDTLVGGIAHELNNKLTPVLGFAQLIEIEGAPKVRDYTGAISQSVTEAADIIRQLLQLSKPHTGSPQIVNLDSIVDESLMMLTFQVREAKALIKCERCPSGARVLADPGHLKQVVMNLVLNALHAVKDSASPLLELSTGILGTDRAFVRVSDNGIGIDPSAAGRIFDPFYTTKAPDKGSGLGLSICQSLVRQHGGEITVESELGKGAVFTVLLPRMQAMPAVQGVPIATPRKAVGGQEHRVLIVEDEDVIRRFLEEALRSRFGCRVETARNGAAALSLLEREDYSLIVSDIRMPEVSGPEMYRRLRVSSPAHLARVVFVTGHVGDSSLEEEISGWGVPVVAKPFKIERLVEVCGPILARVSAESGSLHL